MSASNSPPPVPTGKPPAWANRVMRALLRTPGVQRLIGRGVALLTFTGRRTGNRYTIPISYERSGDTVTLVTKTVRTWWRNLPDEPEVTLRLAGREHAGTASIQTGTEAMLPALRSFLERRPMDARAYGLTRAEGGTLNEDELRRLLPHLVLITVTVR